jgi:hypothetical protein
MKVFRTMGTSVIIITLLESLFAGVLTTLSFHGVSISGQGQADHDTFHSSAGCRAYPDSYPVQFFLWIGA